MKRIVIRERTPIPPFGEPARNLRVLNKPLWLLQRDLLVGRCKGALEVDSLDEISSNERDELLVHKDNLFFNQTLVDSFITQARANGVACQIAFAAPGYPDAPKGDAAIMTHALRLQNGIQLRGNVYVAELYYFPQGVESNPQPLVIDTEAKEMGYYHVPSYMGGHGNDLVFKVPLRAFLSIESWVHIFMANSPFGVFALGRAHEAIMDRGSLRTFSQWEHEDWQALRSKIGFVLTTFKEKINPLTPPWRNSFFSNSKLVKVGKNCSIDPTAIIHGPTIIGDNVTIGAGTVITNSLIGSNVNIMQGCQVMLSVVSDRCYLPFNAALFMTTLMENTMVAQNSTLQLCVVGRNTFIGANNVFTDFDLLGKPIHTFHNGKLEEVGLPVLGSAVGHNVKIGSGFVVYPARMIGSNTTLLYVHDDTLVRKNVSGLDPDDVDEETGEPRSIVYRWPHIYQPDGPAPVTVPPSAGQDADERTQSLFSPRHPSARLPR